MEISEIYRRVLASYYGQKKQHLESRIVLYRYVYRPLSLPITAVFLRLGLSANQVTALGLLLLVISLVLLCQSGPLALAGVAGYFLFFVLDFVDGAIARFNGTASYFGKLIDGMVDSVGFLIFTAVALLNIRERTNVLDWRWELFLGLATTIAALIRQNYSFRLAHLKREASIVPDTDGVDDADASNAGRFGRVLTWIYDNLAVSTPLLLPVAVVAGALSAFTVFYFVLHGVIGISGVAYSLMKNRRALEGIERQH